MHVSILRHVYVIYPGKTAFLDPGPRIGSNKSGKFIRDSALLMLVYRPAYSFEHVGRAFDMMGGRSTLTVFLHKRSLPLYPIVLVFNFSK